MTIRGQYHFNVSLYQSLVLRRAGLSPPLQRPTGSLVLTFHFPFPAFSPLFLECLLTKSDFCAMMRPSNEVRWQQCSLQQNECLAPGQKNWPGVLPCAEHAVSEEPHSMTVSLTGSCFQPRLFFAEIPADGKIPSIRSERITKETSP